MFEKPKQNETVHSERFDIALEKASVSHGGIERNTALPLIKEMVKFNEISEGQAEEYIPQNITRVLRKYELLNEDAKPYRCVAGFYFGIEIQQAEEETKSLNELDKLRMKEDLRSTEEERNAGMPEGERFDPED